MKTKDIKHFDFWDCDNDHEWLSYPGPHKDTWHLEQLHESTTGSVLKRDPRSAWLVAGSDASICPICAMRMRLTAREKGILPSHKRVNRLNQNPKISA